MFFIGIVGSMKNL